MLLLQDFPAFQPVLEHGRPLVVRPLMNPLGVAARLIDMDLDRHPLLPEQKGKVQGADGVFGVLRQETRWRPRSAPAQ